MGTRRNRTKQRGWPRLALAKRRQTTGFDRSAQRPTLLSVRTGHLLRPLGARHVDLQTEHGSAERVDDAHAEPPRGQIVLSARALLTPRGPKSACGSSGPAITVSIVSAA
jgi:hypothetical protein